MKLGIHITNMRTAGGQVQVLHMMLEALFNADFDAEVFLLSFSDQDKLGERYMKPGWQAIDIHTELGLSAPFPSRRELSPQISDLLNKQYKLDLLLLPTWTDCADLWDIPLIFTVHDVQHRLQPEFPEVSAGGGLGSSWRWREQLFRSGIARASAVITDSEQGKQDILRFYECEAEKVFALPPTLPPTMKLRPTDEAIKLTKRKYGVPEDYVFYPAQLWPHKNHYRLVEAAGLAKNRRKETFPLVFVGSEFEQWKIRDTCEALAESYAIADSVFFLGYVPDEEMAALFAGARMLAMPTYFGPTNIPYLEAFHYDVPVLTSDVPGIKEQVGEAALLAKPEDSEQLAQHITALWHDPSLCRQLIREGRKQLEKFSLANYQSRLLAIIESARKNLTPH